jgi:hypothetical protein
MSIEYYTQTIREIDAWLEKYDGDDEDLIDKKLNIQEKAIEKRRELYNLNALCL